ncbi:MAG: 3-phosphoshikimate 1-carboxyvinyltransferase [Candidatus Hodarchaeota archaeon]
MNTKINPIKSLNGEIIAPPSKSYSHRVFIAASLAEGISIIKNPLTVGDVGITIEILKKLGTRIVKVGNNTYMVKRIEKNLKRSEDVLDCKNSGTSIRIFSVLSLLIEGGLSFTGDFLKKERPIRPLLESLNELGAKYKLSENILSIKRVNNNCNIIRIPGDISSQFITSLLMICPILNCENKEYITIEVISPIISYPYIEITKYVLDSFGINVLEDLNHEKVGRYYINSPQSYRTQIFEIPGDFSSIANIIAATILAPEDSRVVIHGLNFEKPQGDRKIIEILCKMGANIKIEPKENQIIIYGNRNKFVLKGIDIDIQDNPDLFPILSVVGAFAKGKTTLYNGTNLEMKESDRISVVTELLTKMGVKVKQERHKLTVYHCEKLKGSIMNHEQDHRIAMAFIIASLYAESSSQIKNINIVADSYPNFLVDLNKLGAKIEN